MKKLSILIIILIILSCISISGCTEEEEKILEGKLTGVDYRKGGWAEYDKIVLIIDSIPYRFYNGFEFKLLAEGFINKTIIITYTIRSNEYPIISKIEEK